MTNIATLLKSEISRIARKEVRAEALALKKTVSAQRASLGALKQRLQALELQLRRLGRAIPKAAPAQAAADAPPDPRLRFSAKGLASQRKRLGLSAHDCGRLIGVTGQSIYQWEDGKTRPRPRHLPAIAALRTMGKREVAARLADLGEGPQ